MHQMNIEKRIITRRDFIKISAAWLTWSISFFPMRLGGLSRSTPSAGLLDALSGARLSPQAGVDLPPGQQGRVLVNNVSIYDRPSEFGEKVNAYWFDSILPISQVTASPETESHNPIWYRVGSEGYVHSGSVQPVRTILQQPNSEIPAGGILAEVTVPFTDARWSPGKEQQVAYRFYYETTYWVIQLVYDESNTPWYSVLDDKWELVFYVPATHMRLIPAEELAPLSPAVPPGSKKLEVNLREQILVAYEMDEPVYMARVATGARFSTGNYSTPPGWHMTFHKRPSRHMARGNLAANGYDLPGVPWNSYITESGIAIHGTYWHNNFGRPRSHGCINLTPKAAKWVYRWTMPVVPPDQQSAYENYGTLVEIREE